MPPIKSAKSLYDICLLFINSLLLNIVKSIERKYGPYSGLKCQIHLQNLQDFLVSELHCNFLDTLLQNTRIPYGLEETQKIMLLAICVHPEMRFMLPSFKLPPHDAFYISELSKLNKILVLDLTMVCTDEILKTVGNSCPVLEEIRIVSKVESVTSKTRKELNALKLKFFVSDEGLQYLHKCKTLKRIIMNKMLRSNCGGRKISHDGIRELLIALPKLQYISYSNMGLVLEKGLEGVNSLNLLKLQDNHTTPDHIDVYSRLCPNLKDLRLKVPMTSFDQNMPNDCIARLADSNLKPVTLELGFFPFENEMKQFLKIKGVHLTSFSILCGTNITSETLFLLGKFCPNLKCLELKILQPSPEEDSTDLSKHNFYSQLETLQLTGVNWDPAVIFPLCMYNAKNLQTLGLINREYKKSLDQVFEKLLERNPLRMLTKLCLHEGFLMKHETLENFVLNCPNLISVTLGEQLGPLRFLETLRAQNNFDLQLQCDNSVTCSRNCHCYNGSSTLFFF